MIFVDVALGNEVESPTTRIVRAVAKWVADTRAARKKRATLHSLLFAPEHRLRDLGIRREELLEALRRDGKRGNGH